MLKKLTRYEEVAQRIRHLIENGTFKEGERLPSLRQLSTELKVSINTVKEAYWRLESQRHITAVPQSGYYVCKNARGDQSAACVVDPTQLNPQEIHLCQIFGAFQDAGQCTPEIRLAIAHLDPAFYPAATFERYFREAASQQVEQVFTYSMAPGSRALRAQVARLGLSWGLEISPDEVVITNGCQEALFLALMTVCQPGDTVVLESPIYFSLISLLKHLELKIIEIPTIEGQGVCLETLTFVLENHPVKAMFAIPTFNNPLGFAMPSEKKKKLVQLLARHGVPLIEDDIYGDLCFGSRPEPCKVYDDQGEVILCSSFSKTLAPGLRTGYMLPGKYTDRVSRLKTFMNIGNPPVTQMAVERFLREGGYQQHLRRLRRRLEDQVQSLRAAVLRYFPSGTKVTRPEGGVFLWIELPSDFNTDQLYHQAIQSGILIAPGSLFSVNQRFTHHLRLSAGTWNQRVEKAIMLLGRLCNSLWSELSEKRFA